MSSSSVQLVKEAIRQERHLEPYNDEAVRRSVIHINSLFSEAQVLSNMSLKSDSLFDVDSDQTRLMVMKALIEREKRNLLTYIDSRLSFCAFAASSTTSLPEHILKCLTKTEADFIEAYVNMIVDYRDGLGADTIDLLTPPTPPQDYYIQIRVVRDCGSIQTETGVLDLTANSLHFVRRVDVQGLIDQGLVMHIQ